MSNIRYICCQPANNYFVWQVEVMINNFKKMGVNPNQITILASYEVFVPENWLTLQRHYNTVQFFFYPDTRADKIYQPSIYFHLLAKHFKEHPELENEVLFTHDSDTLLTRPPQFDSLVPGKEWYASDCNSYINYSYVVSKGEEQFNEMCRIVGIDPNLVIANNANGGGAQYLVKNTTKEFWEKVERDSVAIYNYLLPREANWSVKDVYPIQKWTAGMWAYLWNGFLVSEFKVDPRMSFGWATNMMSDITTHPILHNAGVVNQKMALENRLFFKGAYTEQLPYNKVLDIDPTKASYWYWNEVQETAKITVL